MSSTQESSESFFWAARAITNSPEETERLGEVLVRFLAPGVLVALYGELGTGKTTLVRGLARGLGLEGVRSPSFKLASVYEGGAKLYHFDFYRLSPDEVEGTGFWEALAARDGLVVCEWAERVEGLPPERVEIGLQHLGERRRSVDIVSYLPWMDHAGLERALWDAGIKLSR